MQFTYAPYMAETFPSLATGLMVVSGIHAAADTSAPVVELETEARERLGDGAESGLPEIQAWRAAYSRMGFKPTQVRCASEALLRRLRQHGSLPRLHPLVDLCNAASAAAALPVAAFDLMKVNGNMLVGPAEGTERYEAFGGGIETPEAGEIVFRDDGGNVHARRWVNRQSGLSAIGAGTTDALIVIEGLHEGAERDVTKLRDRLAVDIAAVWNAPDRTGLLIGAMGTFDTSANGSATDVANERSADR